MTGGEGMTGEMPASPVETTVILSQRRRNRHEERSRQRYRTADAIPDSCHFMPAYYPIGPYHPASFEAGSKLEPRKPDRYHTVQRAT